MSIYRKVQAVEKLFHLLEKDVATFQQATGLRCKSGCGMCCTKPDIAATTLEFLPFAYALAKNNLAHQWLQKLRDHEGSICINLSSFLEANGGFCTNYNHRGLICRLFGFSAMKSKNGPQLVTCKTIKTEFAESYEQAKTHIQLKKPTPILSNYYSQLRAIDPVLGTEMMPINQAMMESIKVVLSYYSYRRLGKAG